MTAEPTTGWHDGLAAGHSRHGDGELAIGGIGASTLAQTYGTPLLVIDTDVFDAAVRRFEHAFTPHDIEVAYAGKALLFVALARRLVKTSLSLDVCSLGELQTAEAAAFPASRITLHGCAKDDGELDAVAQQRVGTTIVDSLEELDRLSRVVKPGTPLDVMLRINAGIEAHTHAFVRTGGENSKFGLAADAVGAALSKIARVPALRFTGLHSHIGSQILDPSSFVANVEAAMQVVAACVRAGFTVERLIAGGGFGIEAGPDDEPGIDIAEVAGALASTARERARTLAVPLPRLGVEPGRSIVARAGTTLYTVMDVKQQGKRRFVIIDGGLADNPRPAMYGAYHHPVLASRVSKAELTGATICGRSCENDEMVAGNLPADVRAGDLLALCTTGAYTYSMAGNYNRFPKPAVAFAAPGGHKLAVRRELPEDVLRYDVVDA